jgi:hypothetical protein
MPNPEEQNKEPPQYETAVQKLNREYEENLKKPHPIRWFLYIFLGWALIYMQFFVNLGHKAYNEKSTTLTRIIVNAFSNFTDKQTIHTFFLFLKPLSLACIYIYI